LGDTETALADVEPAITVVSVAVTGVIAPPPATLTEFTKGELAPDATFTVTAMGGKLDAAANTSDRVQVAELHVQPCPVIVARVRPAGRLSVTVTVPIVDPPPV
jgi:hypothetical protein